jgi:hypothetical protein
VGEPRRQHGRREAVVCQRYEHGVEQRGLAGLGHAPLDEQERELGEGDLAHQLAREVVPADGDRVGGGRADVRA